MEDPLLGGAKQGSETLSFIPFGHGQHRCLGQAVGTAVAKTVVCRIIQSCKIEHVSDAKEAYMVCRNFTHQPFHAQFRFVRR